MHSGNTHPPALCADKAPDEKLKFNKIGILITESSEVHVQRPSKVYNYAIKSSNLKLDNQHN